MSGLEVIGAGFGRSGTQSLQAALERLGLRPCYHMDELNRRPEHLDRWQRALDGDPDWPGLFDDYRAAVDWPTCFFWSDLRATWPGARIILSVRDADAWYDSMVRTAWTLNRHGLEQATGETRRLLMFGYDLIFERTFDGRFEDRDHAVAVYEAHRAEVEASVDPDDLLVHRTGDGWEPLCAFLDRPVPDEPYPHSNSGEEFRRRVLGEQ